MLTLKRIRGNSSHALIAIVLIGLLLLPAPFSSVQAAAGDLDTKFGSGGKVVTDLEAIASVNDLAIQPDGKIIAAGVSMSRGIYYAENFALARYNADGSLDASFGSGGKVITEGSLRAAEAVIIQPDGRVIAAGLALNGTDGDFGLARYNANGSLDITFGTAGRITTNFSNSDRVQALALQSDGKLIAAGNSADFGEGPRFALARYEGGEVQGAGFDILLQDDGDGALLEFNSITGEYRFSDCRDGIAFTGQGKVKIRACKVELRDSGPDHHLKAKADLCTNAGKISIEFFSQGVTFKVKDKDITDNSSPCR